MPSGNKLITAALTIPLSAGLAMTSTLAPALAETAEVAERAEAAKEAQAALDDAAEKSAQTDKALEKATSKRKKAKKRLTKAEATVTDAIEALDAATDETSVTQAEVDRAAAELEELQGGGVTDVAAEAGTAITGESDSELLSMVGGFLTAGVAGVVGPAVQAVTPAADAAKTHVEKADRELSEARERAELLKLELRAGTEAEREANVTLVQAEWAATDARAALREANQAEKKASSKQNEATDAKDEAAAASKKATKKLREAEAIAEAEAEAKKKAAAKKKAEAEKKAKAQREEAASGTSRSLDGGRTVRPGTGEITSPYGMRTHPITGVHKLHSGTDFSVGDGRAYAARSGTVAAVTYDGAYGNMVTLSHGGGIQTRYAHLSSTSVSTGQKVGAGDVVGQIGSTGYSTGAHLHFEVLQNGEFINSATWLGL